MWHVPHQSFFYWLCACTLYFSVIMNLANLNTFVGHNLLISYLHYYRSWNKYEKHSHSKMNVGKTFNVIIHEIPFYITNFLFMCALVMTQGLELLWLKNNFKNKLWVPIGIGLDLGSGFYELQHVYSMHVTPIKIIDFFGKFKFKFRWLQLLH
jgi:hypothetical protein